jgi:hypothetical protein
MSSDQQNSVQPLEALAGLNLALDPAPPEEEETPPPLRFEDLPQDLRRECLFRALEDPTRPFHRPGRVDNGAYASVSMVRASS